jgi:hypothetical protein
MPCALRAPLPQSAPAHHCTTHVERLADVDVLAIVRTGAVLRYIARTYDLYGAMAADAARCDQAVEVAIGCRLKFVEEEEFVEEVPDRDRAGYEAVKASFCAASVPLFFGGSGRFMALNGTAFVAAFVAAAVVTYADFLPVALMDVVAECYAGAAGGPVFAPARPAGTPVFAARARRCRRTTWPSVRTPRGRATTRRPPARSASTGRGETVAPSASDTSHHFVGDGSFLKDDR